MKQYLVMCSYGTNVVWSMNVFATSGNKAIQLAKRGSTIADIATFTTVC